MCLSRSKSLAALLMGSAAFVLSSPSLAQTQTAGPQTASQVGEVVVTAQKRAQKLLSAPVAVTAIGASDLQRTEAIRFSDYVAKAPGLNLISDREGETQIILRGITTGTPVSSTVATYIDDTPYGSSTSFALGGWLQPDLDPSDIERVEVLRGPQGTLYGATSLGGVIKFITTPPNLTTYGGRVEVDGSTVDGGGTGGGVRGMVNVPIIDDSLALRASAYYRRDPGYVDDSNLGKSNLNSSIVDGGRVSLLWKPTQSFSLDLTALTQNLQSAGSDDVDVNVNGTSFSPSIGDTQQLRYTNEPLDIRYRLYSATINNDFGWAALTSVTSYANMKQSAWIDETQTFGAFLPPDSGTATGSEINLDKLTEEVRLASPSGQRLEWQGGLFFTHERISRQEPSTAFSTITGAAILPQDTLFYANIPEQYNEYAVFGDVTYHFTPQFDVLAGVRYGANKQYYTSFETGSFVGGPSTTTGASNDSSTTYLVTPSYKFDANNMIYARLATGYRPGGPNAPSPFEIAGGVPLAYRPDTLTSYEAGYKAALLEHALTLELSAFHIDWQHIQIETDYAGITSPGNGGTARSDGFEANAVYTPVHGLTLSGNLAYTDAHLTQDAPGVGGVSGDELPNVPKWAANFSADYDFRLTNSATGFVGGGVHYLGDRESGFVAGTPAGFARPILPAYTTVDLRAGVNFDRYALEIYVKNVGDTRGYNNITSLALSGYSNPWTASLIQPRTVGASLSARF